MSHPYSRSASPSRVAAIGAFCIAVLIGIACMPRGAVIGSGEKTPTANGTISGVVRAAGSNAPLTGRLVTATELTTGAKFETSTSTTGGYSMKVPTGRYRLVVELRDGETVADGPSELTLNVSDVDAARDFLIAVKSPGGI